MCLSLTDRIRQNVVHFIHFKHFKLYFNFIFLELVGKKGTEDSKKLFPLRKNSLLSNWTQIAEIILVITTYDHSNENLLNGDLKYLKSIKNLTGGHILGHAHSMKITPRIVLSFPTTSEMFPLKMMR